MASFDKKRGSPLPFASDRQNKLPIKRLEPALCRFTQVAIPTDMDRIKRHKYNLEKYKKWKSWSKLDIEKNNSERTIKQLKSNVQDINAIRTQVCDNDLSAFDDRVKTLIDKVFCAINELEELIKECEKERNLENEKISDNLSDSSNSNPGSPTLSPSQSALFHSSDAIACNVVDNDVQRPITTRHSLSRFEATLHKFTKITIPTTLDRLRMHCQNMKKFHRLRSWADLNSEQVHAAIAVKHLKSNIEDIEITRRQVPLLALKQFDHRVGPSCNEALAAIESFMEFQKEYNNVGITEHKEKNDVDVENTALITDKQLEKETPDENTLHSWDDLQTSLVELNELIHHFSNLVFEQQEAVDSIAANIEHAHVNVHEATNELGKAAKLQGLLLPTLGAVVGGIVGGPVGMFAGLKGAAVLTAVSGGVLGFGATNYLKNKREESIDQEMEKLTGDNKHEQP